MREPVTILTSLLQSLRLPARELLTPREAALALVLCALAALADPYLPEVAPPDAQQGWVQLVIMVALMVLAYALSPKPPQPAKPTLEDIDLPTAEEGRPIPVPFGDAWITGANILWYGDLDTTAIKVKGGKK